MGELITKGGEKMANCADCRYCEYKPRHEFHLGTEKDEADWYCHYWEKWLGTCSGKCSNYDED